MTSQSNSSQGRGHDRLPNWNPKNGGMLISQPISSCLTNHSELCMSRLLNSQPRRISIYRLQRRSSFGFESSGSSTPMTSSDTVIQTYGYLTLLYLLTNQQPWGDLRSQSRSATDQLPAAVQNAVTLLSDWLPTTRYPWRQCRCTSSR